MDEHTHQQRAERIAAELRKAEDLDPYSGQQHTTSTWVLAAATEIGLREMERRLRAGEEVPRG